MAQFIIATHVDNGGKGVSITIKDTVSNHARNLPLASTAQMMYVTSSTDYRVTFTFGREVLTYNITDITSINGTVPDGTDPTGDQLLFDGLYI